MVWYIPSGILGQTRGSSSGWFVFCTTAVAGLLARPLVDFLLFFSCLFTYFYQPQQLLFLMTVFINPWDEETRELSDIQLLKSRVKLYKESVGWLDV